MSETDTRQSRPNRPKGKQNAPEGLCQWKQDFFREVGWKSKIDVQNQLQNEMVASCAAVETHFNPDPKVSRATALGQDDLDAGPEFKAFLAKLESFEKADLPRSQGLVEDLRAAAQTYLDHYDKHFDRQKKQPKTQRKADACREVLADLRGYDMRQQLVELGDPPWQSEQALQASELKAMLDLESLPAGQRVAEPLDGSTASAAFWINRQKPGKEATKSALFKPDLDRISPIEGFPSGGEPVREAMAARTGDVLTGMTMISFGIPETNIISLDCTRLPEEALLRAMAGPDGLVADKENQPQLDKSKPLVGSVQQFISNKGAMRNQPLEVKGKIPAQDCQKIAILDTITLNMDRHGGNLMINDESGTPNLVPIDHGLTFPPAEARKELPERLGDKHNALLGIASAYEPFSAEMLNSIAKIEPGKMVSALKQERGVVDAVHEGTAAKLDDEALEASRRSAMFLKLAAPVLAPAVVQIALGQNAKTLFEPGISDTEFTKRAQTVIDAVQKNGGAYAEYFLMTSEEKLRMEEALVRNGWPEKKGSLRRDWLLANMALALKLYRADMRNPTLEREALQTLSANELSEQLKQRSLSSIVTRIRLNRPAPQRDVSFDGAQAQTELEELNATFPKLKLTPEMTTYVPQLHAWRQVKAKGGMVAVTDAVRVLGYDARDEAQAKASPIDAVTALEQSESHGEAMLDVALRDFDDKAQRDAADAQTLQYAQDLAALLPADDAARLLKLLTARWDGVKRALPAARRKVVEDIRNTMFDKAREVLSSAAQSLPKNPFPPGSMEASRWAAQMTSVEDVLASGNLFRARDELNQMKASIPNG